jgi:Ser/Thr protein kinase RdoA (MazF antagonist)
MGDRQLSQLVEDHFGGQVRRVRPLGRGLINRTFLVESGDGSRRVLQAVNPIFPTGVNEDIDAVTTFLASRDVATPRLLRSVSGEAWVSRDGEVWRMLSWIDGVSCERLEGPEQAAGAGRLLGRFHHALKDLQYEFHNPRLGVHDTPAHLRRLEEALRVFTGHRFYSLIRPLAEEILAAAATIRPLPPSPDRVVHGDPKINNILFEADGKTGLCLVDLDTLGRMPLPLELGDALRSWCNLAGEDAVDANFSEPLFEAAVSAYAGETAGWLEAAEWQGIVGATETIFVELAARFCADALHESYFGWDPQRYASRSEHNLVRARGQLSAFRACSAKSRELARIVQQAFDRDGSQGPTGRPMT